MTWRQRVAAVQCALGGVTHGLDCVDFDLKSNDWRNVPLLVRQGIAYSIHHVRQLLADQHMMRSEVRRIGEITIEKQHRLEKEVESFRAQVQHDLLDFRHEVTVLADKLQNIGNLSLKGLFTSSEGAWCSEVSSQDKDCEGSFAMEVSQAFMQSWKRTDVLFGRIRADCARIVEAQNDLISKAEVFGAICDLERRVEEVASQTDGHHLRRCTREAMIEFLPTFFHQAGAAQEPTVRATTTFLHGCRDLLDSWCPSHERRLSDVESRLLSARRWYGPRRSPNLAGSRPTSTSSRRSKTLVPSMEPNSDNVSTYPPWSGTRIDFAEAVNDVTIRLDVKKHKAAEMIQRHVRKFFKKCALVSHCVAVAPPAGTTLGTPLVNASEVKERPLLEVSRPPVILTSLVVDIEHPNESSCDAVDVLYALDIEESFASLQEGTRVLARQIGERLDKIDSQLNDLRTSVTSQGNNMEQAFSRIDAELRARFEAYIATAAQRTVDTLVIEDRVQSMINAWSSRSEGLVAAVRIELSRVDEEITRVCQPLATILPRAFLLGRDAAGFTPSEVKLFGIDCRLNELETRLAEVRHKAEESGGGRRCSPLNIALASLNAAASPMEQQNNLVDEAALPRPISRSRSGVSARKKGSSPSFQVHNEDGIHVKTLVLDGIELAAPRHRPESARLRCQDSSLRQKLRRA